MCVCMWVGGGCLKSDLVTALTFRVWTYLFIKSVFRSAGSGWQRGWVSRLELECDKRENGMEPRLKAFHNLSPGSKVGIN